LRAKKNDFTINLTCVLEMKKYPDETFCRAVEFNFAENTNPLVKAYFKFQGMK
jgi:hypothetical protein